MNDTKPWWQSNGVWGSAVGLIGAVLKISPADQAAIVSLIDSAMIVLGTAVGLWGRLTAKKKLTT